MARLAPSYVTLNRPPAGVVHDTCARHLQFNAHCVGCVYERSRADEVIKARISLMHVERDLMRLRVSAHGASHPKLRRAMLDLDIAFTQAEPFDELSKLAGRVKREADKLRNERRLREFEKRLVAEGRATLITATPRRDHDHAR